MGRVSLGEPPDTVFATEFLRDVEGGVLDVVLCDGNMVPIPRSGP